MKTHLVILLSIIVFISCAGPQKAKESRSDAPDATYHSNLGKLKLYQEWDFQAAETAMDQALELDPNLATTLGDYAWYHILEQDKEAALEKISRAISAQPDSAIWILYHGWICLYFEDHTCAEKYVNKALEMDPSYADALFVKGLIYIEQGEMEKGIDWLENSLKEDAWLSTQALIHMYRGETEKAKKLIEEIETKEITFQYMPVVGIYSMFSDTAQAMNWARKVFEARSPLTPWIAYMPPTKPLRENEAFRNLVYSLKLPKDPFQ